MSNKTLLKHVLNVKNTVIDSLRIEEVTGDVIISVHSTKGHSYNCPVCGKRCRCYDKGKGLRKWRALDWGSTKVFIEAPAIRIECPEHGVHTAAVPWARHHSSFTRHFENTVSWMALYLPKTAIAEYMRIAWNTVGPIISRFRVDADPEPEHRFNNLKHIGIDETSYRKGHTYITVVINHDTNSVIWVHDRHGKEVLREFFETLTEEQRSTIECVTADGARWISETMDEYIPNADRCLDMYHMVEWAQEAIDTVRKESWNRARLYDAQEKRSRGRPRKGEEPDKTASKIKGTKYALGKAPEHLTERQTAQLEYIANTDPKLYRAYKLKEYLRTLVKLPIDELETALKDWLWKASHSRIKPIYELQLKIRRHYDAILNTAKHKISNARVESMNNQIKLTLRVAYGFRNIKNMIDMIMLKCSDLEVELPYKAMKPAHTS